MTAYHRAVVELISTIARSQAESLERAAWSR